MFFNHHLQSYSFVSSSKHLDNPSRQRVQEELESALRERDEAHERARLEHQRTVLRLQKDHAASEVTFRSIVTHLEEQLRLARDEVNRVADEARSVTSGLQREIAHDRERHATSLTSAVAKEKLKTEQEAFQLLREIEDQYHKKYTNTVLKPNVLFGRPKRCLPFPLSIGKKIFLLVKRGEQVALFFRASFLSLAFNNKCRHMRTVSANPIWLLVPPPPPNCIPSM